MGMLGPLTAQALGRSPYDDVVDGEGEDDPHQPTQLYDPRGRPINPETKKINRDLVRAHNEVMLVIGIAEPENSATNLEAESQRRHEEHDDEIATTLLSVTRRCVDVVGCVGLNCLRTRILTYRRYSHMQFQHLYSEARGSYSIAEDILAGAPAELVSTYLPFLFPWGDHHSEALDWCFFKAMMYIQSHLEIYAALQRLGFVSGTLWLPPPSFFIPFTADSPILRPPPLESFELGSVAKWVGGAVISATPFILWTMSRKITIHWKCKLWQIIYPQLPNTYMRRQKLLPPPLPLPPPPPPAPTPYDPEADLANPPPLPNELGGGVNAAPPPTRSRASSQPGPDGRSRQGNSSTLGDEYGSDEEDGAPGVTATMISFDVEATDAVESVPGYWSAELRPSQAENSSLLLPAAPTYFDTLLTRAPPLVATDMLTEAISRVVSAPFEATALRILARTYSLRYGVPLEPILSGSLMSGLNMAYLINFLVTELIHFGALSDLWAVFAITCQQLRMSEEEWKRMKQKHGVRDHKKRQAPLR